MPDQTLTHGPGSFVCGAESLEGKLGNLTRGMVAPLQCDLVSSYLIPISAGQPPPVCEIWTDAEIVDTIRHAGPADPDYDPLRNSVMAPGPRCSGPKLAKYLVESGLLFHGHWIVPS
ncbi:uncharacterized protein VP01_1836g1 [Puccinia sorghi]|uniref:Uncharacterized protein n=1 Tax=Puccinia sorghi TaxID=27349 RepID=A0A0L6VFN2_9BASI|nr:uncharacterized protein VP01_1836g1 [Puccinia sorghi]